MFYGEAREPGTGVLGFESCVFGRGGVGGSAKDALSAVVEV